MMKQTSPVRLITASLFTAVLAGTWDVWWHGAIGRETFWSPPHLLLYASVIIAIVMGIYGWRKTRERSWPAGRSSESSEGWRWFAIVLLLIPASAPFDELWHRVFGVEEATSPLIVWSPPHVVLTVALITSFLLLFARLEREEPDVFARYLLQSATLACVLSLLLFLGAPLDPIGPYHLLGFAGAAVGTFLISVVFLLAREWMQRFGSTLLVAGIFLLLSAMSFGEKLAPGFEIQPHDHPPGWLMIFACLLPAGIADLLHGRALWLRGLLIGLLHGGILFGFATRFFKPEFQYSVPEMGTAILASAAAGLLAGALLPLIARPRSFSPIAS